jgi:hypothetical protein
LAPEELPQPCHVGRELVPDDGAERERIRAVDRSGLPERDRQHSRHQRERECPCVGDAPGCDKRAGGATEEEQAVRLDCHAGACDEPGERDRGERPAVERGGDQCRGADEGDGGRESRFRGQAEEERQHAVADDRVVFLEREHVQEPRRCYPEGQGREPEQSPADSCREPVGGDEGQRGQHEHVEQHGACEHPVDRVGQARERRQDDRPQDARPVARQISVDEAERSLDRGVGR